MRKKHLFIVNPVAGGRDSTELIRSRVAQAFSGKDNCGDFEIYTTKAPKDATEKIKREAECYPELWVYACGGDGTLNECVSGAAGHKNVALACVPTGTGNDFIKIFGNEAHRFGDITALIDGETHPIDLIRCNDSYSINICSVGIDARIGTDVHKYSHLPVIGGPTGYVVSTAVNFVKGVKSNMHVVCDGKLYYGDINLVCACNGAYYGGGFHPVPEARPDDGIMDILVVKGVSRMGFARFILPYAKGKYSQIPKNITHIQSNEMTISAEEDFVVNLDGESITTKTLNLKLIPNAMQLITPKNTEYFS